MHIVQLLLVSAEDHETARANVHNAIYPDYAPTNAAWSDWSEADGTSETYAGRWAGSGELGDKAIGDTLRYSDDPETADRVISQFLKLRSDELYNLRTLLSNSEEKDALYSYNPDPMEYYSFPKELWTIGAITELLTDRWSCNSGVYDVDDFTGSIANFYNKVEKDPKTQFLVMVDFHY
jgi:hypothetical protein